MNTFKTPLILFVVVFFISGCSVIFQTGRRSDAERIRELESELAHLRDTKGLLEATLSREIEDKQVRLSMEDKGLVVTFVAEVLFNSGKAELREDNLSIIEKVADILKEEVPENFISIEGHTDDQPIKHSLWKSNWELSSQRALSVLESFELRGVNSEKMSATGYGEYHAIAANDTKEGRQLNRRVEIVIAPLKKKTKYKTFGNRKGSNDERDLLTEEE